MGRNLTAALEGWLEEGRFQIGQIRIERSGDGFLLRHAQDGAEAIGDLQPCSGPEAARELARNDAAGNFRPLKTAPDLRRGWELALEDIGALRLALDAFYPAALGLYRASLEGTLQPVDLRSTMERQTGMYAVTRHITDGDADAMIGRCCASEGGCLRKILWKIDAERPVTTLPGDELVIGRDPTRIPLLCSEVCNLVVAEARRVVKAKPR